jgi:hypothetical protein
MFNRVKNYLTRLIDAHTRKGRHSANYIHLFYIDPANYVGAHA